MLLRSLFLAILVSVLASGSIEAVAQKAPEAPAPADGFVPNAQTAIAIARAILVPIYGREQIEIEEPLSAKLEGEVWTVRGHLPPHLLGGVAEVEISKHDGRILHVFHGR
jgi:hypothetical protein